MKKSDQNSRAVWKLSGTVMLVVSIVFLSFGAVLIPSMGLFGVVWAVLSLLFLIASLLVLDKGRRRGDGAQRRSASAVSSARIKQSGAGEGHDHIPSMALDREGRLRQLDSLQEAGLVTQEEYQIKREEILSGR